MASGISINNILGSINPQSITSANIGSISSGIDAKMESITADMESKMSKGITEADMETITADMEAQMNSFESDFNPETMGIGNIGSVASKLQAINFM